MAPRKPAVVQPPCPVPLTRADAIDATHRAGGYRRRSGDATIAHEAARKTDHAGMQRGMAPSRMCMCQPLVMRMLRDAMIFLA
jgi:hypothetical protein